MNGRIILSAENSMLISSDKMHDSFVAVKGQTINVEIVSGRESVKRKYPQSIECFAVDNEIIVVNTVSVDVHARLASLSESGILADKPKEGRKEFLKAMEIVIRSVDLSAESRHEGKYDLCDLTHCIHYEGIIGSTEPLARGIYLADKNYLPVYGYFHSTCGGVLSPPSHYWNLQSNDECYRNGFDSISDNNAPLCADSPHVQWRSNVSKKAIDRIAGFSVTEIEAETINGRVATVIFHGKESVRKIGIASFMSKIGREAGWNAVKSDYFTVKMSGDNWFFWGKGLGHGTGLCQYGASKLASLGWSAERILSFYFPGAKLAVKK